MTNPNRTSTAPTVRSVRAVRYGGPDALEVHDVPGPRVAQGDACVAVVASSINPVDIKMRSPRTPQMIARFPSTLGWDLAGVVLSAPPSSPWRPGDRVLALHPPSGSGTGSWSQTVALPATHLARAPKTLDLVSAAALPLAALTALQALDRLAPGQHERLLVTGAAGAVGGFAVQLAALRGVAVSGLVSRPAHVEEAIALGAGAASTEVDELSGFDTVLDTAGAFGDATMLREGGRLVTVSDDTIPKSILTRASSADHNYVRLDPAGLRALVELVDAGALRVRVDSVHPFVEVRAAHDRFERGGLLGKVVLTF